MLQEYLDKKLNASDPSAPVGSSCNPSFKVLTIANVISFSRILLTLVFFFLFIQRTNRFLCVLIYAIAAITDFLDGQIARRTQTVSWVGKLLDPAVDRFLLFTGVVGLWWVGDLPLWIPLAIVGRDALVGLGMLVIRKYRPRPLDVLFIGKLATATLMVGFTWLLLGIPQLEGLGIINVSWLPLLNAEAACPAILLVYAGTVLSLATGIGYILEEIRVLQEALSNKVNKSNQ